MWTEAPIFGSAMPVDFEIARQRMVCVLGGVGRR
jgi:hypothetical protein